jgi:hypothetical protein
VTEPIVVILQTWERTSYALRTIDAALAYLRYPNLLWYIADDGSRPDHYDDVHDALVSTGRLIGGHSERAGYGANANHAWRVARDVSRLTFFLEDDWELRQPLDLYPYAALLMERPEVGMVRLGVLNLDVRGRTWGHDGRVYWTLDREPHHEGTPVFTGHPSLRHTRYWEAHGDYPENLGPGDTELAYAYHYRMTVPEAPAIVWPADYPAAGLFGHIGSVKTETMLEAA